MKLKNSYKFKYQRIKNKSITKKSFVTYLSHIPKMNFSF